jgi:hypothetical protein
MIDKNVYARCRICINDCKNYKNNDDLCDNYIQGKSMAEYLSLIREENINIKRLCKENKFNKQLDSKLMWQMLKGKMCMLYKYRMILENHLYEDEWIDFVEGKGKYYGE